ncbi:hypothetical protein GQ457_10G026680 [Hibiscus cannabinus]
MGKEQRRVKGSIVSAATMIAFLVCIVGAADDSGLGSRRTLLHRLAKLLGLALNSPDAAIFTNSSSTTATPATPVVCFAEW